MSSSSSSSPPSSSSFISRTNPDPLEEETITQTLLIPNLPNDLSALILSSIPYSHRTRLKATCKSWKHFFSTLRHSHHHSHLLCIFPQDPSLSSPFLFDPRNLAWCPLPPMPLNPHAYGLSNFISVSLNHHVYVLGGSVFDTRSFPMDRPTASAAIFRYDLFTFTWERRKEMVSPKGSFACAAGEGVGEIFAAGGGSRHAMFGAAGSRMSGVERYDVERDEWVSLDGLPRFRAGCVGFLVGSGEEREFWVMGGYGESRTISGVFPVDEYYRDGAVLELRDGGKWREIGNMWEEGERRKLGSVVVVDRDEGGMPGIFMLDGVDVFRYNITTNRWEKETTVPCKGPTDSTFGFAALDGELHVLSRLNSIEILENRTPRMMHKRVGKVLVQIYHPRKRRWRSLTTKPPFHCSWDFRTAVMSTIRI